MSIVHELRAIFAFLGIMTITMVVAGLVLATSEWNQLPAWMRHGSAPFILTVSLLCLAGWAIGQWIRFVGLNSP